MGAHLTRRDFLVGGLLLAGGAAPVRAGGSDPPLAVVTADLEDRVVIVNLASRSVVGRVSTPVPAPRAVERVGDVALIAHSDHGALSVLDPRRRRILGVIEGMGEPRYVAAHPSGRLAYVTDSGRGEVAIVDVARRRIVGRIDVDGPARHVSLDPSGRVLWTSLGSEAERIAVLALDGRRRTGPVRFLRAPDLAHDVVITPDGRQVWITSGVTRRIVVHDLHRAVPVFDLAGDAPPQHVAMHGRRVLVASGDDGTLREHDRRGRLLRTRRIPIGSYNLAAAAGEVVTPSLARGTLVHLRSRVASPGRPDLLAVGRAAHDACVIV